MAEPNVAGGAAAGSVSPLLDTGSLSSAVAPLSGAWKVSGGGLSDLKKNVDSLKSSFDALNTSLKALDGRTLDAVAGKLANLKAKMSFSSATPGSGFPSVSSATGSPNGNGMTIPSYSGGGGGSGGSNMMSWSKTVASDAGVGLLAAGKFINNNMDYITQRNMVAHQLGYTSGMPYVAGADTGSTTANMSDWLSRTTGSGSGYSKAGGLAAASSLGSFGYGAGSAEASQILARGGAINKMMGTNDATGTQVLQQMYSPQTNMRARQLFGAGTINPGGSLANLGALANNIYSRVNRGRAININTLNAELRNGGTLDQTLQQNFGDNPQMIEAIKRQLYVSAGTGKDVAGAFSQLGGKDDAKGRATLKAAGVGDTLFNAQTDKDASVGTFLGKLSEKLVPQLETNLELETKALNRLTDWLDKHPNANTVAGTLGGLAASFGGPVAGGLGAYGASKIVKRLFGKGEKVVDTSSKDAAALSEAYGGPVLKSKSAASKLKSGLKGGVLGLVAAGGDIATNDLSHTSFAKHHKTISKWGQKAAHIGTDAATGAALGSILPGPGTAIGATLGTAYGLFSEFGGPQNGTDAAGDAQGQTFKQIEAMANGVPNRVTSTTRGGHASNSLHYRGDAVDFGEPGGASQDSPGLLAINQYFAKKYGTKLSELIYAGPGGTNIKDGQVVDGNKYYGASTMAEHHNHVHVGITPDRLGLPAGPLGIMNGAAGTAAGVGNNAPGATSTGGSVFATAVAGALGAGNDIASSVAGSLAVLVSGFTGGHGGGGGTAAGSPTPAGAAGNTPSAPTSVSGNIALAKKMAAERGWTGAQWDNLYAVWNQESSFNEHAGSIGAAYGIPQAMPGSKMASAGADWATNPATQIKWGLDYIKGLYGDPIAAEAHKHATDSRLGSHAQYAQPGGWYAQGSWEIERDQTARIHKGEMIIPADMAESVRGAAKSGAKAGSGGDTFNNTFNLVANGASESEAIRLAHQVIQIMESQKKKKEVASR